VTTIAAVQGENWAVVGYDSRVTEENEKIYTLPKDNGKLFKNGAYLIGVAGDMRAINLLSFVFKPPAITPTTYGVKLDKFMTAIFIPELKKCFEDNSYSKDGDHLLGTLETRKRTLGTAKTLVRQALTIAARLDPNTSAPICINVQHF